MITKNLHDHRYPIGHKTKIVSFQERVDGKNKDGYNGEKYNGADWSFTDEECEAVTEPKQEVTDIVGLTYSRGIEAGKLESEVRLLRIYNEAGANITAKDLLDKFLERNK